MNVLRRITALLAMIALLGLLLLLLWQVHMHYQHGSGPDEPAVVSLSRQAGWTAGVLALNH